MSSDEGLRGDSGSSGSEGTDDDPLSDDPVDISDER